MKLFFIISMYLMPLVTVLHAQDFITRGRIEYEVKINFKAIMRDNPEEFDERDLMGQSGYQTGYRELIFADDQWVYRGLRKAASLEMATENSTYVSLAAGIAEKRGKYYSGNEFLVTRDSIPAFKWKIGSETRKIAGWECRKAITRIHDSVYVVAFYCPEIVPKAGPGLFNGLPGMILGLAIPRYYTTWFATKVELADIDESKISSVMEKKDKVCKRDELIDLLLKKYKADGWKEVTREMVIDTIGDYAF